MSYKSPAFLDEGDTVRIVATARKIDKKIVDQARVYLEKNGFIVEYGRYLFSEHHQFAGTDEQRAQDFQDAIEAPNVKAILCARGGYGSVRMMDLVDWERFTKHPKWIVGYSDVTAIHSKVHQQGFQSIHGTMPINFSDNTAESIDTLVQCLKGNNTSYKWQSPSSSKPGRTQGTIIGGNLSMLYSMMGSKEQIACDNKILFLEDLDEYLYHIDRMMHCLKRAGMLDNLAGLIIGGMTDMHDNTIGFGQKIEDIILNITKEFNYPIGFQAPVGHMNHNLSLVLGKEYILDINSEQSELSSV